MAIVTTFLAHLTISQTANILEPWWGVDIADVQVCGWEEGVGIAVVVVYEAGRLRYCTSAVGWAGNQGFKDFGWSALVRAILTIHKTRLRDQS
jgi:hypothetical protein